MVFTRINRIRGVVFDSQRDLYEAIKVLAPLSLPDAMNDGVIEWNEDSQMYIDNGHNDGRCKCGCQETESEEREEELTKKLFENEFKEWANDDYGLIDDFAKYSEHNLSLFTWACCSECRRNTWVIGELQKSTPDMNTTVDSVVEDAMSPEKERILMYFGKVKTVSMLNYCTYCS